MEHKYVVVIHPDRRKRISVMTIEGANKELGKPLFRGAGETIPCVLKGVRITADILFIGQKEYGYNNLGTRLLDCCGEVYGPVVLHGNFGEGLSKNYAETIASILEVVK